MAHLAARGTAARAWPRPRRPRSSRGTNGVKSGAGGLRDRRREVRRAREHRPVAGRQVDVGEVVSTSPSSVWNGGPPCAIVRSTSDGRLVQIAVAGTSKRRGSLTCTAPRTTWTGWGTARRRNSARVSSSMPSMLEPWAASSSQRGQRDLDRLGRRRRRWPLPPRAGRSRRRSRGGRGRAAVDDLADERAAAAVADEDDVAVEAVDEVGDGADVVGARDVAARRRRARARAGSRAWTSSSSGSAATTASHAQPPSQKPGIRISECGHGSSVNPVR